ncbi:MAG: OmpA family protein [Bacteroidales bacterium]
MKRTFFYPFFLSLILIFSISSCVSSKKYEDVLAKNNACKTQNDKMQKELHDGKVKLTESEALANRLKTQLETANNELDEAKRNVQRTSDDLDLLQKNYDEMNKKYTSSLSGKNNENQQLVKELQSTREFLNKKELELKDKEALLAEKEKRVNELQAILDKKDQDLQSLKNKVMDALLGFKDKGLTVSTKNGKVYVSMDEKLLFSSGSWTVGKEGKEAIREVGFIMQKNPDINVLIEGHTDNIPLNRSGEVKDNWDLSVMRATSIVKTLLENKGIDPKQVSAAGRGEFLPVISNDTKENRAKNRRSEIILTPNLDELFKILGDN